MATTTSAPITILLVDDFKPIRQGLRAVLDTEPDLRIVGEAGDGRLALELSLRLKPDLVLLDVVMPELDGIRALPLLRRHCPQARLLILSNFGDEVRVREAIRAGAHGYMLKDASVSELLQAIRQVSRGGFALHPSLIHLMAETEPVT